jgi:hypothetical protein
LRASLPRFQVMAHRTSLTPRRCWAIAVTMPSLPVVEIIATPSFWLDDSIGYHNNFKIKMKN